jgi:maleylacetoacetate isomerase
VADYFLYDYWRSSAAFRVRLALAWKGLDWQHAAVDLRHGEQSRPGYVALNPQGLVPLLVNGDQAVSQSLAIMEYLDEVHPEPPLLPATPAARAMVRSAAMIVACDVHPLNNLRVLRHLRDSLGQTDAEVEHWCRHWIEPGLAALEAFAAAHGGHCLWGNSVTIADLCLLPQLYNSRRVGVDLAAFPRLVAVESHLAGEAFVKRAHPDQHADHIVL